MTTFKTKLSKPFDLPKRLERLGELAYNLWWTLQPEAARLFGKLDYDMWERLGHNPIRLLREIGRARLSQAVKDKEYPALYDSVLADFDAYFSEEQTWTRQAHSEFDSRQIAYFSMGRPGRTAATQRCPSRFRGGLCSRALHPGDLLRLLL